MKMKKDSEVWVVEILGKVRMERKAKMIRQWPGMTWVTWDDLGHTGRLRAEPASWKRSVGSVEVSLAI